MTSDQRERTPLRKIGGAWKPRPGSKAVMSGSITVNGLKQKFLVLPNDRKDNDTQPDFLLMSNSDPEVDPYASRSRNEAT